MKILDLGLDLAFEITRDFRLNNFDQCFTDIPLSIFCPNFSQIRQIRNISIDERYAQREKNESVKLTRTLCLIFVVFAVSWTPYAIIVVADKFDTFPTELHIFSILIAHTNSSLNSILYGLTNKHFRVRIAF